MEHKVRIEVSTKIDEPYEAYRAVCERCGATTKWSATPEFCAMILKLSDCKEEIREVSI